MTIISLSFPKLSSFCVVWNWQNVNTEWQPATRHVKWKVWRGDDVFHIIIHFINRNILFLIILSHRLFSQLFNSLCIAYSHFHFHCDVSRTRKRRSTWTKTTDPESAKSFSDGKYNNMNWNEMIYPEPELKS